MQNLLINYLEQLEIGHKQSYKNLAIYPLLSEYAVTLDYLTMDEALSQGVIDVVEIDPSVVDVAMEHFSVTDDPRMRIFVMDGRTYLREAGAYDIVVLDAYSRTYVPFHLMTREFFEALDEHLNPGGVVVSNLISSLIGDTSDLLKAEVNTIGGVLSQVYLFPTRSKQLSMVQNIILVATSAGLDLPQLIHGSARLPPTTAALLKTFVKPDQYDLTEAVVLTDNKNPAELIVAQSLRWARDD